MALERFGSEEFDGQRLRRPGTWVVAFMADWCPFCRRFAPQFEQLAGAGPYQIAMGDVTNEDSPLWDTFEIQVIPTVVVFRDGAPVFRRDGRYLRGLGEKDLTAVREALAVPA